MQPNSGDTLLDSAFFPQLPCLISFLCQGNELSKVSPELCVPGTLSPELSEFVVGDMPQSGIGIQPGVSAPVRAKTVGSFGDTLLNSAFLPKLPCLISFLCHGNELSKVSPEFHRILQMKAKSMPNGIDGRGFSMYKNRALFHGNANVS